jgi:integrase/recombinase XerD
MSHPSRVRMTGPLRPFVKGFTAELAGQGYLPGPAASQLQLIAHLSRWLDASGLGVADLVPSILARFLAARRTQGYVLWLSPKALRRS